MVAKLRNLKMMNHLTIRERHKLRFPKDFPSGAIGWATIHEGRPTIFDRTGKWTNKLGSGETLDDLRRQLDTVDFVRLDTQNFIFLN